MKNKKKLVVYSILGTSLSLMPIGVLFLKEKFEDYEKEYYEKQRSKNIEKQIEYNEIYGGINLYLENKDNEKNILDPNLENYQLLKQTIENNKLIVLTNHFKGYLTVSSEGLIYFLDENGKLYNSMDKYLENRKIEDISDNDLRNITQISEKETFTYKDYVLIYEPVKNTIYQEIYKNGKHIGKAFYKKIDDENTIYFEDDKKIISASSLEEFSILYDNLPYILASKADQDYSK